MSCLRVTDSAECAIRLAQGEADFGIFNAEELLLTYQFYPSQIQPLFQLRHKERQEGSRNNNINIYLLNKLKYILLNIFEVRLF